MGDQAAQPWSFSTPPPQGLSSFLPHLRRPPNVGDHIDSVWDWRVLFFRGARARVATNRWPRAGSQLPSFPRASSGSCRTDSRITATLLSVGSVCLAVRLPVWFSVRVRRLLSADAHVLGSILAGGQAVSQRRGPDADKRRAQHLQRGPAQETQGGHAGGYILCTAPANQPTCLPACLPAYCSVQCSSGQKKKGVGLPYVAMTPCRRGIVWGLYQV